MATERELSQAKSVYLKICETLDDMNWKYTTDADNLMLGFGVSGDDIPMDIVIGCDADRQLIRVLSKFSYKISEDKRVEAALAVCGINYRLADGSFDMNIGDGSVAFRLTAGFRESLIDKELIRYLINVTCSTVDEYNDKIMMISKGVLSIQDFLNQLA